MDDASVHQVTLFWFFISAVDSFDWSKHPAIERLSKHVDLQHNCGYITMVNLGRSSRNNVVSINRTVDSWVKETQTETLKELTEPGKGARRPPHLDITCPKYDPSDMVQNWMILDCSFGIPLFHMETNRKICDAIVSAELWKPERWVRLKCWNHGAVFCELAPRSVLYIIRSSQGNVTNPPASILLEKTNCWFERPTVMRKSPVFWSGSHDVLQSQFNIKN